MIANTSVKPSTKTMAWVNTIHREAEAAAARGLSAALRALAAGRSISSGRGTATAPPIVCDTTAALATVVGGPLIPPSATAGAACMALAFVAVRGLMGRFGGADPRPVLTTDPPR